MDEEKGNAIALHSAQTANLILEKDSMDSMLRVAEMMASSKIQVPDHFKGSAADCLAVVMQSMQWKMNPFTVAQKTFLQNGKLSYEAQLVNAVAVSSGAFQDQPDFKFIGDWQKILGNVIEKQGKSGGKYYVAGWTKEDEKGLGVICSATLAGESQQRSITVMMTQAYPRFSTQWATDPQQQLTYLAVRKFCRRYAPGALLGVYTDDEMQEAPREIDITPAPEPEPEAKATELPVYTQEQFEENKEKWLDLIKEGKEPLVICGHIRSKYVIPEEIEEQIMELGVKVKSEAQVLEGEVISNETA